MEYKKPELRNLNNLSVSAICSTGSGATGGDCITNGTAAADGCSANGNTANVINCEAGGAADQLGPNACDAGTSPSTFCNNGVSV